MRWVVDLCYLLAAAAFAPIVAYRRWLTGKYRRDWDQRRGLLPQLPPGRPRVWIHAVSMGEMNSIRGLVEMWRARCPELDFVISATTDTGIDQARKLFKDLIVVRYPLDFSRFVRRALDRIAPTMIVLVEAEVWYQFISQAKVRNIPVVVINGRLTEQKSMRRFRWIMPIARRMFGSLTWVGALAEEHADRFRRLGVPADRVTVTGSMKWDTAQVADSLPGRDELARAMGIDRNRPVWVCGSTGDGEEAIILRAYALLRHRRPQLQLMIVPRKPERFDEVAELIRQSGFACLRRSRCPDGDRPAGEVCEKGRARSEPPEAAETCRPALDHAAGLGRRSDLDAALAHVPGGSSGEESPAVRLGDTMGELRKFYALADVVFVGRTLADMGGSDMMEVAGLGRPIIVGPHTENFAEAVERLDAGRAIRILSVDSSAPDAAERLAEAVSDLLDDPVAAGEMARRGQEIVKRNRGATERTVNHLMEIMERAQHDAS
ncbi:MAG TPA: 3-deoxy-D-manno-octulosonic acid transferase [Phycisphaerae bacterium]|nr:3-deoxy-D-manno-octulosonic acid transferase [Phycisphaerae bacterium]